MIWPTSKGDVADALTEAATAGVSVVPWGAGSGVVGGASATSGQWTLDLKRLAGIGPLDPVRRTVEVDAGVNGQQLEDWLQARGFTLGHSPSSIGCSTVGGWAAARSAGQFSSRYGTFEDMIVWFEAVSPSLGHMRVGEGGDAPEAWAPLMIGSEGTLAVFTRFALRVWPVPEHRRLRGWQFPDVQSALNAMRLLMDGETWPAVVRLYDPVDTRIGGKTRPKSDHRPWFRDWLDSLRSMPGVSGRALSLPLALPGLVNHVFDRLASGVLLIVGWEGGREVTDALADAGEAILREGGTDLGEEPGQRWFASRHNVSYKLMPIFADGGFADTMEVATTWAGMEPLWRAVRAAVRRDVVVMCHMSHVYPEGGCLYFSFAGRGDRKVWERVWRRALDAVAQSGATTSHHHGIGRLKASSATAEAGIAREGWRQLKRILDPGGLLNPGVLDADHPPHPPADAPPSDAGWTAFAPGQGRWPWADVGLVPPWRRAPWMTSALRVSGPGFLVGRAPRSASGPDLRDWAANHLPVARIEQSAPPDGDGVMARLAGDKPWAIARAVLHADFRPGALGVDAGQLAVGFRGPAADALMSALLRRFPGERVPWRTYPWPWRDLVPCDDEDPAAVTAWLHSVGRPR